MKRTRRLPPLTPGPFPDDVIDKLAVAEFVELDDADARQKWARDHGVDRILSARLVDEVRRIYEERNRR